MRCMSSILAWLAELYEGEEVHTLILCLLEQRVDPA